VFEKRSEQAVLAAEISEEFPRLVAVQESEHPLVRVYEHDAPFERTIFGGAFNYFFEDFSFFVPFVPEIVQEYGKNEPEPVQSRNPSGLAPRNVKSS